MSARVVICRSNPIAPDPRVEKEAQTLFAAGYATTMIGWDRTAKLPEHEDLEGIACIRLPIPSDYARGIRNLPALLRWQWGLLRWLMQNNREYDIIHACDFDTLIPGLVCKYRYGKKVVYDIFDFYADHLRATPGLVKKLIRSFDIYLISKVDALILADDSRWEQIHGAKPVNSAVIYNSPQDVLQDLNAEMDPEKEDRLRLAYIGLLQYERGLRELLTVLKQHPEWKLDLAGFGGDEEQIVVSAEAMPNFHWHGRISYRKALQLSYEADALVATYDPAIPNHRYSSPNKIFEAMMLGKPIIVAKDTNMDRLVAAAQCGLVVPYGDLDALEAAISRLNNELDLRQQLGANARRAYETTYSWSRMSARLLDLYGVVLSQV